jgi:hypothetical protein
MVGWDTPPEGDLVEYGILLSGPKKKKKKKKVR